MEVLRYLVILIFLIAEVKSTNTLRISVSDRKANWNNAGKTCQMIRPTDFVGINRTRLYQGQPQSDYAWIKASVSFTPWTLYHGCLVVKREFIKHALAIPVNKDHLLFCIKHCNATKYLGLKDSRCVCLEIDVINSVGSSYVNHICKSTPCTFDKYVICGSFNFDTAYAVYEIVTFVTRIDGFYNCLSAHKEHNFTFESSNCEMNKNRICQPGYYYTKFGNWTSSNVACNLPYTKGQFDSKTLPAGQYWTAYSRRSEENDFSVKNPEYCVAAKVGQDGSLRKAIRKCDEELHVLCKGTEHQSMDTVIVSVLSTVALSLIIGFIVCIVRKKRGSTERNGNLISSQQQIYAEIQRLSRDIPESRDANDVPSCSTNTERFDPSSTDEVYDHTNHTLRPRVTAENNYDVIPNVMAENEDLENVYNTSNQVVVFNTVVDDSSEYSLVKIV